MEKRKSRRFPRRFEVRVRRQGEEAFHVAFTVNLSQTGAFLGTQQLYQPGERVHLEFLADGRSFSVEGRVVRARRVPATLRQVETPGVGIRFVPPEDLVAEILGSLSSPPKKGLQEAEESRDLSACQEEPVPAESVAAPRRVLRAPFPDRTAFLSTYHRDLAHGRLFLGAADSVSKGEAVEVRLEVGSSNPLVLQLPGRIVRCLAGSAASTVAGIWIELAPETQGALQEFAARVRTL